MPTAQEIRNHLTKPVILIGMMGSGKTTLGRALASALNLDFNDSDHLIEQKAGLTITEIFEKYGEEKFRTSEASTIKELLDTAIPQIIATGGGAILNAQTREYIKAQSLSIWLNADIDTLYARISKNQNRPLLQTKNPKQTLQDLMDTRKKFYEQADLHFTLNHTSTSAAVNDLLEQMQEH